MTSPADTARAFLTEAVAKQLLITADCTAEWDMAQEIDHKVFRTWARAVLNLLLGTPPEVCPDCRDTIKIEYHPGMFPPCPTCNDTKLVAGRPPLRIPCPTCDGTQRVPGASMTNKEGVVATSWGTCQVCTDGFSPLAAIDAARGIEQVGWGFWRTESDGGRYVELRNERITSTANSIFWFPAPDRTEQ